eukprot:TRINITY_DN3847_c0_g1_i1.p1 TRINITY_DN3847_c0_g1~~TRINITY_DN3847_c0_g1_i1.p1  ORF type:complete len:467 (-),score=103.48 TRINITY_DN3847_c0_g1_i1:149-1549(-)
MVDYEEDTDKQDKIMQEVDIVDTSTQTEPKVFVEEKKSFDNINNFNIEPQPTPTPIPTTTQFKNDVTQPDLVESPHTKRKRKWKFRKDKVVAEVVYQTSGNSIRKYKFHRVATKFARAGFFFKALLYASISVLSISAAVDAKHHPEGPQSLFQDLKNTLSAVFLVILIVGLFCYSSFGVFYGIFNIDQIPNKAGNYLKRFGRCVSALFYGVLGIDGILILVNASDPDKENENEIVGKLFQSGAGQVLLVVLAAVFFIVSIVYFAHACRGNKFRCELATERLGRRRFLAFVTIARIGALGRVLFFGTFGGAICKLVSETNNGNANQNENSRALNIEGVLVIAAQFSPVFLFIVAALIFVYAFWNLILCVYRRIPAHNNQNEAIGVLGINKTLRSMNLPDENPVARVIRADIKRTVQTSTVVEHVDPPIETTIPKTSNNQNNDVILNIPNPTTPTEIQPAIPSGDPVQ